MTLIKGGRVAEDPWRHIGAEAEIPPSAPVIVPLARWIAERAALVSRIAPVGVRLAPDDPVEPILADLDRLAVIALEFTAWTDGRPLSSAALLRRRHRYRGEIRAVGEVRRDMLQFMARCGFDAFETGEGVEPGSCLAALDEIGVFYQPAADGRPPVAALRRGHVAARMSRSL